jgi:membrane-associated protease RseP (regulator of RpoE activity)
VTAVDGWGVGGRSISYVTRSSGITLGPVKIDNLVVGYGVQSKGALADPSYQGNVGSGLLKRFVVTFDYDRQIMFLKALPTPVPDTNVFDRAGMWINASAKGLSIVDITAGGPAAAAGLKVGDEITAVDGAPAASLSLTDVRERLRNAAAGTVVTLALAAPGGPPRTVALTLKDQI